VKFVFLLVCLTKERMKKKNKQTKPVILKRS